ncbi:helix-turn-helix domain-containing protein [Bacillus cereus group sp. BfR-BA-01310]|uniref:helix-turn-helix domain-containing protein n=1 Tax=Bacillus cereus group sp. BfR-BA-01310 TaxID=2920287 RepID=UPI001F5938D9
MKLNSRFEIHPTEEQQHTLERWISICRQQYNSALLDKQRYYKQNKKDLTRYELQDQQKLDKKIYHFLKEVPSQPLQEVFARLEKAYKKFFKKDAGYPKRKSFKEYRSITLTQFGMFKYKKKFLFSENVYRCKMHHKYPKNILYFINLFLSIYINHLLQQLSRLK